jgi:membrane protein DedA with SNARE-associated domain
MDTNILTIIAILIVATIGVGIGFWGARATRPPAARFPARYVRKGEDRR